MVVKCKRYGAWSYSFVVDSFTAKAQWQMAVEQAHAIK